MFYKLFIRPLFFLFNPETAHKLVFAYLKLVVKFPFMLKLLAKMYKVEDECLEREVFGLKFKNPIGIAAGLDKNAEVYDVLGSLGFSHVEIGTITPKAQPGNPKPRLFRLVQDGAIINRMGFNNHGVENAIVNLKKKHTDILVGGNIGKNKVTPNEEADNDYKICFEALFPYVDYFAVNISSPNTPNLRELQSSDPLRSLLGGLMELNGKKENPKPILLKIAPDLSKEHLDNIIDVVLESGIDGIIATNTTITRDNLLTDKSVIEEIGNGGLSGVPVKEMSTEVVRHIRKRTGNDFPIIAVGGVMTPEDVIEKMDAGATLVQIYTGFIYEGPGVAAKVNRKLIEKYRKQ